jgi:hypothetical protein
VKSEYERARKIYSALEVDGHLKLVSSGQGDGALGLAEALAAILGGPVDRAAGNIGVRAIATTAGQKAPNDAALRERRQFNELQVHVQNLLRLSSKVRTAKWAQSNVTSLKKWSATIEPLRDWTYDELIGSASPTC